MIVPYIENHIHTFLMIGAAYFLVLSISNVMWLRMSSRSPAITVGDRVSVLIPVRDEELNIGKCLESLLEQTYTNYEIIVLDDQSADDTWEIITDYERRYPELVKAVKGEPLPSSGWTGKAHAMQQLSTYATGEYFLFTDADTVHSAQSIAWAVSSISKHRVDFVSGYVYPEMKTFGEQLIVPAMYMMSAMLLPLWLIACTKTPALSFAIGQFMMFRKHAYQAIGGYSSVSDYISDDVFICRELKKAGFRTIFLDIKKYVKCRMYHGYRESFNGISKNIYDFVRNKATLFTIALTFLVIFVILPLYLFAVRLLGGGPSNPAGDLSVLFFFLAWSLALIDRGVSWWVPFYYPMLFVHLLYMAWRCFGKSTVGRGVVWKGREIK